MVLIVGNFQKEFTQYTIFYNTATEEFTVDSYVVGYYDDTQPPAGVEYYDYCVGVDKQVFISQNEYPYAYLEVIEDSPSCGYNPDGDDLSIDSVNKTNETTYQANDGSISPIISGGDDPYLYSLDGINFDPITSGQTIPNLAPNDYTLTIQDSNGIQKQATFTIEPVAPILGCTDPSAENYDPAAQIDNGSCTYPDPELPPAEEGDNRKNIYEGDDQFRLINSEGEIFLIDMPKGWEKITLKLERDKKYHGVNYEFSDGEIQLQFDIPAGKELLDAEYDANGNDGFMQFQFGMVYPDGTFIPDVDAYVDFVTKTKNRDYFEASVKRKTYNDAIETKNEIDVTLKEGYFSMPLHAKLIRRVVHISRGGQDSDLQQLIKHEVTGANPNYPAPGESPFLAYYIFPDFSEPKDAGAGAYINNLAPLAPGFGATASNPIDNLLFTFKTDGNGQFDFNIAFSQALSVKLNKGGSFLSSSPRIGYWSYKWFLCVNDFGTKYELPGSISGFVSGNLSAIGLYETNFSKTLNLVQGDRVYLFGQFVCESRGSLSLANIQIRNYYSNIDIVGGSLATPTFTQAKLAFEVAQDILADITEGEAKLVSNLLGREDIGYAENGCASLIAYTNGYLIRNFNIVDHPIKIKLKDYIEGLDTNFCIGMGYELNDQNEWVYRIEQFEYFYKDELIMVFDNVEDYEEPIETELIYNQLDFGYEKYTQDLESADTLDEFLTRHTYLTPIQSLKKTLTKICKQIFAGYAIELTRRIQFADEPVTSWTYDEDNFCIAVVQDEQYTYRPEKLENFEASGILSPETAYNIRYTITRMLARWAKWINSGLAYKTPAQIIKNTYVSKNGDLVSKYIGTETPCESDIEFTESQDLLKGQLANGEQTFFPDKITFKTKLSWEKIREIRRCFVNKDVNGRNNGYFGVIDGNGVTQYGFLMSMEYNPVSEEVNFVLRKKFVDLNEPFDCEMYSDYTFADFEAATGLPKEIEQCLFNNFA